GNEVNDGYGVIADGLVYVWNGTAFQSQRQGMDLGLKPDENSKVEEGNPMAVSGGEVFDYVNDQKAELLYLNSFFNSRADNNLQGNLSYDVYRLKVRLNDSINITSTWGSSSGVMFGYIAFSKLGESIDSWIYSKDGSGEYTTQNVIAPEDGFILVNVRKTQSSPFKVEFLTNDNLLFKSSLVNNENVDIPSLPVSSSVTYKLNSEINAIDSKIDSLGIEQDV